MSQHPHMKLVDEDDYDDLGTEYAANVKIPSEPPAVTQVEEIEDGGVLMSSDKKKYVAMDTDVFLSQTPDGTETARPSLPLAINEDPHTREPTTEETTKPRSANEPRHMRLPSQDHENDLIPLPVLDTSENAHLFNGISMAAAFGNSQEQTEQTGEHRASVAAPKLKAVLQAAQAQAEEQHQAPHSKLAEEAIMAFSTLGSGAGVTANITAPQLLMKTYPKNDAVANSSSTAPNDHATVVPITEGDLAPVDTNSTRMPRPPRPDMSWAELLALNAFWYGYTVFGFLILIVAVPSQIKDIVGDENKGFGLFVLFVVGGTVNFFASIFLGYASDHVYSRFGRRYSWIVAGSILLIPTTMMLAAAPSLDVYVIGYALLTILNVVVSVPFTGLFADVVNSNQRGRGSAVMGAISQLGAMSGAVLGLFYTSLGTFGSYGVILGFYFLCLFVTIGLVREPAFTKEDLARMRGIEAVNRDKLMTGAQNKTYNHAQGKLAYAWRWTYATILFPLFEPMIVNIDFRWVFTIRLLMQLSQYTVQEFLQYFLSNCVELPEWDGQTISPETAVSIVILPMLVFATISALLGGIISDRLGGRRRVLMYASGGIMSLVFFAFIFVRSFVLAAIAGGGLGIGFGAFLAVDFAMVMDVLPSKDDFARDIALWSTALILGQVLATPLAGVLLDSFQDIGNANNIQCLGYTVIWIVAAIYVLLATVFVRFIKGIK